MTTRLRRSWVTWLLLLVGVLFLTGLWRQIPFERAEAIVQGLANEPGLADKFQDRSYRSSEALFVLLAFLLLTPLVALLAFLLLQFVSTIGEGVLESMGNLFGLRARESKVRFLAVRGVILVALTGIVYSASEVWLPRVLWLLGLVARAYLAVRS